MRFIFSLILGLAIGGIGWIAGSLYPAPAELLTRLHAQSVADRLERDLGVVDWQSLRGSLGEERFDALAERASHIAASAGNAVMIERSDTIDMSEASAGTSMATPPAPTIAPGARGTFEPALSLCRGMTVSNAPRSAAGRVANYAPVVNVNGVALAVNPTHGACLSSGFGQRGANLHKGVDFHSDTGGPIMAAGDGTIIEMKYRDDYGNMILIDHGHGVYTRYAHLSNFQRGLVVGAQVHAGDPIGLMGNTASYAIPIHLHYEVLLGDYNTPSQSFGLTPHSIFEYRPS